MTPLLFFLRRLLAAVCLTAAAVPVAAQRPAGLPAAFDCILPLPPLAADQPARFLLGDVHGFLHAYEQRGSAWSEIWVSDYFESSISWLFLRDFDLDGLEEILVYTKGGRFHFLDAADYHTLWSNPPTDYDTITAMQVADVDDDEPLELLLVADNRLVIIDGRARFEEWRSDQDNIQATEILVGDVDGDGADEIVLNDGFVFDARYRDLEWQSAESFGQRIHLVDVDDDGIPEVIGQFGDRFLRIYDIDLRRMKPARR